MTVLSWRDAVNRLRWAFILFPSHRHHGLRMLWSLSGNPSYLWSFLRGVELLNKGKEDWALVHADRMALILRQTKESLCPPTSSS